MPGNYDVELNGVGFILVPGSYQRSQEPLAEGRVDRVRILDFYGGSGRALQQERDRFWLSTGAIPDLDSQGVTAGPRRQDVTLNVSQAFDPTKRSWTFANAYGLWLVNGRNIFQILTTNGRFSGLQHRQSLPADVVDAAHITPNIWLAFGSAATVANYNTSNGTYIGNALSNRYARLIIGHSDAPLFLDANDASQTTLYRMQGTSVTVQRLDHPVRRLFQHEATTWVLTAGSLWKYTSSTAAALEGHLPYSVYDDDGVWVVPYRNELFVWRGRRVVRLERRNGVWVEEPDGPDGQATYGACVVSGRLFCEIRNRWTGVSEIWMYDGRSWWRVEDGEGTTTWQWLVSTYGGVDDAELLAGRGTSTNRLSIWQITPKAGLPALRSGWSITTSMLDAGQRDRVKLWRAIGCELAWPDERASTGAVTVRLEYSTDGGQSWTQAGTDVSIDPATSGRRAVVSFALSPPVVDRYLQLRVTVSNITTWSPVLAGMWAEYELVQVGATRKKWRFTVQCHHRQVLRDGSIHPLDAWQQAQHLWQAFESEAPVTFKDIDYDRTQRVEYVRVVGIRETMTRREQQDGYANREIEVVLVQV